MANTVTIYIRKDDTAPYDLHTDYDAHNAYDETLDEVYGMVQVAGMEYETSRALKELDPIAWRCGWIDWADSEYHELEMPDDLYNSDDEDAQSDWIDAHI
jgi:hypothetical protein